MLAPSGGRERWCEREREREEKEIEERDGEKRN